MASMVLARSMTVWVRLCSNGSVRLLRVMEIQATEHMGRVCAQIDPRLSAHASAPGKRMQAEVAIAYVHVRFKPEKVMDLELVRSSAFAHTRSKCVRVR